MSRSRPDDDLEYQQQQHQQRRLANREASSSDKDDDRSQRSPRSRLIIIAILLSICLFGIGAVVVLLVIAAPFSDSGTPTNNHVPPDGTQPPAVGPPPTLPPAPAPTDPTTTNPPTASPTVSKISPLITYIEGHSGILFDDDPTSSNRLAVLWLAEEGSDIEYDEKLMQRFAVLSLDFALTGGDMSSIFTATDQRAALADAPTFSQPGRDECLWEGIVCNGTVVTELQLSNRNLEGTIPWSIYLLEGLTHINLSQNDIFGKIPESLYDLTQLDSLYLYKNQMTGTLSNGISKLGNLTQLWVNENSFSGSFPAVKSSSTIIHPIRYLNLYKNQFTGVIPNNMRLRNLFYMDLGYNQFTGTLPEDIGDKFIRLRHLHLDHNQLTGTIPITYPNIGNGRLESLTLNHNQLTGAVPSDYTLFDKLVSYTIQENSFTQTLDKNICKLSVHDSGECVEFESDCAICSCNDFFCDQC